MHPGARRALLAIISILGVSLAGCSGSGGDVFAPAPQWSSGFAWTYATEAESQWSEQEDDESDNGTDSMRWRTVREVLNTTGSADGEAYYLVGTQRSYEEERNLERAVEVVRQRDLDSLPHGYSSSSACSQSVCTYSFALQSVNASTPTFLDFPLERGKRWSDLLRPEHNDFEFVYQAEVDGAYAVETGLGTMQAARVSISLQPSNLNEVRQEILSEAAEEGYQVDDLRISLSERHLVYYSSDYQAVVRSDVRSTETFAARGTGPDGEPFDFGAEETWRQTTVVEGASLLPRPERSFDEIASFLAGTLDLRDPTGRAVGSSDYRLTVDPPHATINVGGEGNATFRAAVEGDLPPTHQLRWRLLDGQGGTVDTATGVEFQVSPERPGRYSVELEAVEDNRTAAAAGGSLTAQWIVSQVVDCGPASLFTMCIEEDVPVHPGVRAVHVRVVPEDPLLPGASDVLSLTDSAGTAIYGVRSGDAWTIDLEPVSGYLVDADPWLLEFSRGAAVLSTAQLDVQVLYGEGAVAPAPEPMRTWDRFLAHVAA